MSKAVNIGQNIIAKVNGDTLTLSIDLSADQGPTKSGKNRMVATTGGTVKLPSGGSMLLHLYRPADAKPQATTPDTATALLAALKADPDLVLRALAERED